MTHDDIRKLLGGYATGTLTPEEQRALFAAALEDQELFDALAKEQALRDLLRDPAARAHVLASLDETPQSWWRPAVRWLVRPAVAGTMAACLAVATGYGIWRARQARPPVLVAVNRELRTAPVEPALPAPSAAAVPARQEARTPAVGAMGDAGRRTDRSAPLAAAPAGVANQAVANGPVAPGIDGKLAPPLSQRRASEPPASARAAGSAAGLGAPAGAANQVAASPPPASETAGKLAAPPAPARVAGSAAGLGVPAAPASAERGAVGGLKQLPSGAWAMDRLAQAPPPQLQPSPNVASAPAAATVAKGGTGLAAAPKEQAAQAVPCRHGSTASRLRPHQPGCSAPRRPRPSRQRSSRIGPAWLARPANRLRLRRRPDSSPPRRHRRPGCRRTSRI